MHCIMALEMEALDNNATTIVDISNGRHQLYWFADCFAIVVEAYNMVMIDN